MMSKIKRMLEDIMELYENGYSKEEIKNILNISEKFVDDGIEMYKRIEEELGNE